MCIQSLPILIQNVVTNYHMDVIYVDNSLDNIVYFWAPLACRGLHIDNLDDYHYTYSQRVSVWSKLAFPYIDPMRDWDESEDTR